MDRAAGQVREHPKHPDRSEPAPAPRTRLQRRSQDDTLNCGDCAGGLGKSAEWFRENLERLYARGMPRPIDQPGHRRWDKAEWQAWRRGFKGPKDAANDFAASEPVTIEDHRERLRAAYAR